MAKKRKSYMDVAKQTAGVGIVSMAGMGAMGAMSSMPNMPGASGNVMNAAGAGLGLANIGQMAQNARYITDSMKGKERKVKGKSNKVLDNILR